MKNTFELKDYFSDKEIIKILCRKRVVAAKKRHDAHFLRNISPKATSPHKRTTKEIFSFFPPRRKWVRLNKSERQIRNTNSIEINSIQLERTVWREINNCKKIGNTTPDWLNKLLNFTNTIRQYVFTESLNYNISTPKIFPDLKDKKTNTYRPISIFKLNDLIITGQVAKYLSNCFDPLFSDCSYAFRTKIRKTKIFNHHEAIENIIKFKKKICKPLYVAECDIQKFYDCVNHDVITKEFELITKEANKMLNIKIDNRAIYFFYSYLDAYSFIENVKKVEKELLIKYEKLKGSFPWVENSDLMLVNSNPSNDKIGVPQGGAISCLIANIILNHADKKIIANSDENTFYGRFCDDMILMHTKKEKCQSLLKIYQEALKEVKLISHKPANFVEYGKDFWDEKLKSKLPYKWAKYEKLQLKTHKNVPWLSFVGYQVRYDGIVRIRNKSIVKELKKQVSVTDKIISIFRKGINPRIKIRSIKFRLQQRLISMSVGRFKFGTPNISMCWCAGFKVLKNNRNVSNQIRRLDRNREKQIKRIETYLLNGKKEVNHSKYYGYKYSYYKQFVK